MKEKTRDIIFGIIRIIMRRRMFFVLFFFCFLCAFAQNDRLQKAIMTQDLNYMASMSGEGEARRVVDALCTMVDFQNIAYEEILDALRKVKNENIRRILNREKVKKEIDIRRDIATHPLSYAKEYTQKYPSRKLFVDNLVNGVLCPNIESLSFQELVYVNDVMPTLATKEIQAGIAQRHDEKISLLASNAKAIIGQEKKDKAIMKYALEKVIWLYFIEAHKELTNAYSQISMVSEYPAEAASQYQRLVRACYNATYLRSLLQKEVDSYCAQVNASRAAYAAFVGNNDYPKFIYKVPLPKFQSSANSSCLSEIAKSRQQFVEGRKNVNSASGVVGWIFGGLAGVITKGIGDWMAIDGLVSVEYESRLKYVQGVHDSLHKSCVNYCKGVIRDFETSLANNQKEYENYLMQQ